MLRVRQFYATRIMEPSKLPLEKVFFFVAGIIPGFIALLIFNLVAPGSFTWFFTMGFLGYKTKLGVMLLTAFVVGNSLTTFLDRLLGGVGGYLGARMAKEPYVPPTSVKVAPWRDTRWRVALKRRLGTQAPKDTMLISEGIFDIRVQTVGIMPEAQRANAMAELNREKLEAEMNDLVWAGWYEHYHRRVLTNRDKWGVQQHVLHGLNFNLETTAVYALLSTPFVPGLRHWWCIFPAVFWTALLFAEQFAAFGRFKDPWSSLGEQIEYLSEEDIRESLPEQT